MPFSLESLAAAATIFGAIVSGVSLLQSNQFIALAGGVTLAIGLFLAISALRARKSLQAELVTVEGHSIDSFSAANLRRVVNRTLRIQEAVHAARVEGRDLVISWVYSGSCSARLETGFTFSIHSEVAADSAALQCFGYDLRTDPQRKHPITPVSVGTIGLARRFHLPFLKPLARGDPFHRDIRFRRPACILPGFNTFTSTLSFAQARIPRCAVHLTFADQTPEWVRVYEASDRGAVILKSLPGIPDAAGAFQCNDVIEKIPGRSIRIYAFNLPGDPKL